MTDERKPTPMFGKEQYRKLTDMLSANAAKNDERRPGPPKSGEVGYYHVENSHNSVYWSGHSWRISPVVEMGLGPMTYTPLHDYPLVPGDTVRKLQAELDDLRKVHQDLVAAYERLVNDDTDERRAFEAGREFLLRWHEDEDLRYATYEDWKAAEGGDMQGDGEGNGNAQE